MLWPWRTCHTILLAAVRSQRRGVVAEGRLVHLAFFRAEPRVRDLVGRLDRDGDGAAWPSWACPSSTENSSRPAPPLRPQPPRRATPAPAIERRQRVE